MENSAKSSTTVKDPVCGMNVEPSTAQHKLDHAGNTYYFCCGSCLEKFRADSQKYLAPRPTAAAGLQIVNIAAAAKATALKDVLAAPANAIPPSSASAVRTSAATGAYICPMCPEVRSAKPEAFPRRGMGVGPGEATR